MSRLPIVDFKTMDKVLLDLGFRACKPKGSMSFCQLGKILEMFCSEPCVNL